MTRFSYASTKNKDMLYLVRMDISDEFFVVETDNKTYIFLDSRELGVFKEQNTNSNLEAIALEPFIQEAEKREGSEKLLIKLALCILERFAPGEKQLEVSAYLLLPLADGVRTKGFELIIKNPFRVERAIKRSFEVDALREAIAKTCRAYQKIEAMLAESLVRDGVLVYNDALLTSELLKKEAERVLFDEDMSSIEGMIISCGSQAAIPHHSGSGPIKSGQTIVCDLFPFSKETGYFADMTRTYVKGAPSEYVQKMYDTVLAAQEAALSTIKPGIQSKEIHSACAKVFIEAGFDVGEKGFTHAVGHGLGLDIHELPRVSAMSETVLEPGHVFTIEPGLYYPDHGGVRIEDVVYITSEGYENLTKYPKKFII